MVRLQFINSNQHPILLQVDPWAGLYRLGPKDAIEIAFECNGKSFTLEEYKETRILTLWGAEEYFVIRDGEPVHWKKFASNLQ